MIDFKTYLRETHFPETHWGYWIKADGTVIVVDKPHSHGDIAYEHDPDKYHESSWFGPQRDGWIRIACTLEDGQASFSFDTKAVTKKALMALRDFLRQSAAKTFYGDLVNGGAEYIHTSSRTKMMAYLNGLISGQKPRVPLDESAIEPTEYGYWITDSGKIIPVDNEEHNTVAIQNGMHSKGSLNATEVAMSKGWVRYISATGSDHYSTSIEYILDHLTFKSWSQTKTLIAAELMDNEYRFDGSPLEYFTDLDWTTKKAYKAKGKADALAYWNKFKPKVSRAGIIKETVIPPTNYGYWITTDGKVFPVPTMQHEEVAAAHGFHNSAMNSASETALASGWVRVISGNGGGFSADFDFKQITFKALSMLKELIRQSVLEFEEVFLYNLELSDPVDPDDFAKITANKHFTNKVAALRFLNTLHPKIHR